MRPGGRSSSLRVEERLKKKPEGEDSLLYSRHDESGNWKHCDSSNVASFG